MNWHQRRNHYAFCSFFLQLTTLCERCQGFFFNFCSPASVCAALKLTYGQAKRGSEAVLFYIVYTRSRQGLKAAILEAGVCQAGYLATGKSLKFDFSLAASVTLVFCGVHLMYICIALNLDCVYMLRIVHWMWINFRSNDLFWVVYALSLNYIMLFHVLSYSRTSFLSNGGQNCIVDSRWGGCVKEQNFFILESELLFFLPDNILLATETADCCHCMLLLSLWVRSRLPTSGCMLHACL